MQNVNNQNNGNVWRFAFTAASTAVLDDLGTYDNGQNSQPAKSLPPFFNYEFQRYNYH
jgi:hypothetical protein